MNELLLEAMAFVHLACFKLEEANEINESVQQCVDIERLKAIKYEIADLLAVSVKV